MKYTSRFPNIERWMEQNGVSRHEMSKRMGMSADTPYRILAGRTDPSYFAINAILRITGMTFEEAFKEAAKGSRHFTA